MHLYQYGPDTARYITQYGSNFALTPIVRMTGMGGSTVDASIQIICMHFGAGEVVGYHRATVPQLFLLVAGAGWVCGTERVRHAINPYEAAFWDTGEWHEAGSETGMTALVIEGEGIGPTLLASLH